jgi:urocanate hydratase
MEGARTVRAPRGRMLTARSWQTEVPLRVLIANSNLVGDWANWPEFRRPEAEAMDPFVGA